MRRRLSLLAATAVGVALLAGLGLAAIPSAAAGTAVIEGTGTLRARGSGIATLHGDGAVHIWGHGVGIVLVKGAERIDADGHGIKRYLDDGWVLFAGWRGEIKLAGKDMTVVMEARRIEFVARGSGHAFLKGEGVYCVNDGCARWTEEGVSVDYGP